LRASGVRPTRFS